ncbi:Xaa-Pro peptidase family protein [bacterium]|nr:Xaa-Pro peptidase family protein [bacterium]
MNNLRPIEARFSRANPDRFPERRDRLTRMIVRKSLAGFLVTDSANVHYLTGFRGEDSWLFLSKNEAVILSDSRFTDQIAEECPGLEAQIRKAGQSLISMAADRAESIGSQIGFESRAVNVADWSDLKERSPAAEWIPTNGLVEELRVIKDKDELDSLRHAVSIAERAFTVLRASLRPSDTEKDLANRLDATIRSLGGECSAFPPICAVGGRAALPHAIPTDHRCEESPLLLVDWGARRDMYNSDMTRVLVTGKPNAKLSKVYGVVLEAQLAAIDAIRPGVNAGEIDKIARQKIDQAGYGRYFGHSLGHGLGLRVHEAPGLRAGNDTPLRPGMVITVEPGIYLKDWGGIRIEDDVLVTKHGHEVITSVPKQFEEICLV